MTLATPTIYDLATDHDRFAISAAERDILLEHRFEWRKDWDADITGKPTDIVLHIQDGETNGSLDWWLSRQASSTMLANRDGSLLRCIPEQHGPWTNGDVNTPTAQSAPI